MDNISKIFLLALDIHDALLYYQVAKLFDDVCKRKADVTTNLDKLNRKLTYHVDYFVYFSSIACGYGDPGHLMDMLIR